MKEIEGSYDFGIIGGGLAGLCLAIRLSSRGKNVALFERKSYPFHRVCGEYVSIETLPYLKRLGFDPFDHGAVHISKLLVSGTGNSQLKAELDLGGFGISRYKMDSTLATLARQNGTDLFENTFIQKIEKKTTGWLIESNDNKQFHLINLIGAQGKRSNVDALLNREFLKERSPYLGIKYHIHYDQDKNLIALHNFQNGYCGISRIEDDKYCLCYLAHNSELKKHGSIEALEKMVLMKNKHLKDIFNRAEFLFDKPMAINEITFAKKSDYEGEIAMVGDAAGMIAPLCGNGMAMAIHSSKLLADEILAESRINSYSKNWNQHFSTRLLIGRTIQKTFGQNWITNLTLAFFKSIKPLKNKLISMTHGKPF